MRNWPYIVFALIGVGLGAWLILKPVEPPPSTEAERIPELVKKLTVLDSTPEQSVEGPHHRIKADVERELWRIASQLPVAKGNEDLLMLALDEVYTKYFPTYQNGYIFHYPYLDSVKAITLCDKMVREYPEASCLPQALWLKAFALRVKPPGAEHQVHESFEAQLRWKPKPEDARKVYEDIVKRFPGHPYAQLAKELIKRSDSELLIDLPTWYEKDDPRRP
jgi:hypothetical protein